MTDTGMTLRFNGVTLSPACLVREVAMPSNRFLLEQSSVRILIGIENQKCFSRCFTMRLKDTKLCVVDAGSIIFQPHNLEARNEDTRRLEKTDRG